MLAGCGRGGDGNLWERRFTTPPASPGPDASSTLSGYWEGQVFSGGVRLEIEAARVTLALRCDSAGSKVAQGTARIVRDDAAPATMRLQEDLAGGDADCGFKFLQGDRLVARPSGAAAIEVAFGNASVARLTKLADLSPAR